MTLTRRSFLGTTGLAGVALAGARALDAKALEAAQDTLRRPSGAAEVVARDEAYWRRVAAAYRVSPDFTNLEAGYFGMMAAPVLAAFHRHTDRVNMESSHYARQQYGADAEAARARTAAFLGAAPGEIVLTRGATEALQRLIVQYNEGNDRLDVEPLLTYRVNPFTVFYIGASSRYRNFAIDPGSGPGSGSGPGTGTDWELSSRQFFAKVQYLFRL